MESKHFDLLSKQFKNMFLQEEEYGRALQAFVPACSDICLIKGVGKELQILLGKRTYDPQPDWWIIGGRMRPGESPQQAAQRNLKRELAINAKENRFHLLAVHSLVWPTRKQEPKNLGCHMLSLTHLLAITHGEASRIRPNEEYSEMAWLTPLAILQNKSLHPATHDSAKAVLALMTENSQLLFPNS